MKKTKFKKHVAAAEYMSNTKQETHTRKKIVIIEEKVEEKKYKK